MFSPRSHRPTVADLSIIKTKMSCVERIQSVGFNWIPHGRTEAPHGCCPTSSSASIFLFPGLIFIQNFCQFIMVGNPASCLPTTTCLWFQGLTVFVIDIKLKENTNPRPTDHQVRTGKNNTNWAKVSQKKAQSWVWICFLGWGGESGRSRHL